MSDLLAAKVKAVNAANAKGIELYKTLSEIFRPLLGKQVVKADGSLMEKYKKLLPTPLNTGVDRVVFRRYTYSLAWEVTAYERSVNDSAYHSAIVSIGTLRDGVLIELDRPFTGRTDHTIEEVLRNREQYETAKRQVSEAQARLGPFGEWDH